MVDNVLFYDRLLIGLVWLGGVLYEEWTRSQSATHPTTRKPAAPRYKHSRDPKPVSGAYAQTLLCRL
jgi:hypothetical protein